MIRYLLSFSLTAFSLTAYSLTDAWSVDATQHTAVQRTYKQGETWPMEITVREGLKPLTLTGATARFLWYTNATDNVWWTNSVAVTGSVLHATWTPSMDVGASSYNWWIGVWMPGSTSPLWRVTGTIRMLTSPGFKPNEQTPPVRTLDFASIAITNAPWVSSDDWRSGSNALARAVQDAVSPLASTQQLASAVAPLATTQQLASAVAPLASTQQLAAVQAAIPLGFDAATRLQSSDSNYFARIETTGTATTWKVSITTNSGTLIYGHYDLTCSTNFQTSTGIKPPTNYWHNLTQGVYTNGDWTIWINSAAGPYRYCIRYGAAGGPIWAYATATSNVVNNITLTAYYGTPSPQGSALLSCLYTPDTYTYTTNKVGTLVSLTMLDEAISNIPSSSAIAANSGSGTNITLLGKTDLANALPTNLFARLYMSNDLLVVERVLK